jgi:diketogulonate reductase-like aldo/keto reductase
MLKSFAEKKRANPAQISLAWMLYKYPNVVPIPDRRIKSVSLRTLIRQMWSLLMQNLPGLKKHSVVLRYMDTEDWAVFREDR